MRGMSAARAGDLVGYFLNCGFSDGALLSGQNQYYLMLLYFGETLSIMGADTAGIRVAIHAAGVRWFGDSGGRMLERYPSDPVGSRGRAEVIKVGVAIAYPLSMGRRIVPLPSGPLLSLLSHMATYVRVQTDDWVRNVLNVRNL